jgi:hypothetical protein
MSTKEMIDVGTTGREIRALPPRKYLMRVLRLRLRLVIAITLAVALSFGASSLANSYHQRKIDQVLKLNGLLAVDVKQLQELVTAKGLTVFWAGPQKGEKYLLNASNPRQISLRYLPNGQNSTSTRGTYREVETFVQKNAFATVQAGGKTNNGISFVNAEGNAVYYNKLEPNNVYIGIKGEDLQIQIFDPQVDQSLAMAIQSGRITRIG